MTLSPITRTDRPADYSPDDILGMCSACGRAEDAHTRACPVRCAEACLRCGTAEGEPCTFGCADYVAPAVSLRKPDRVQVILYARSCVTVEPSDVIDIDRAATNYRGLLRDIRSLPNAYVYVARH